VRMTKTATLFKCLLTHFGGLLSPTAIYNLNASVNYLAVGRWMHANGYDVAHRVDQREQLFDYVGSRVADKQVLYLEFGVFQGAATRYWAKLLRNPRSQLHGFDSFEGLPENWLPQKPAGYFSLRGQVPEVDDARVQFFKGWFAETLPHYKIPAHDVLVVNFDADLYSPTAFVLSALEDVILPGTYVYFDEFNHQFHELRAFDEFIKRTGMRFALLGATRTLEHVFFQRRA